MRKWISLCLTIVCMLCFSGCGCAKQLKSPAVNTTQEPQTDSVLPDDQEGQTQDKQEPPPLTAGPGVYDEAGQYIHPEEVGQKPVIEYGHYQTDDGGHKTIVREPTTGPDSEGNKEEPISPAEDLYRDACERTYQSLDAFGASIDFHFYADGRHDAYAYALSFDPARNVYTAADQASGQTKTYAPSGQPALTQRADPDFLQFCRTCSFVPPLSLKQYYFDTTQEGTVVSTVTDGNDYRQALLAASNLFEGFETYDESSLSLGSLYYTAYIDAGGFLTGTNLQYMLHLNDLEIDITVMVDIKYE